MGVGRLGRPKRPLSSRTDASALFGAETNTYPARYGVGVAVAGAHVGGDVGTVRSTCGSVLQLHLAYSVTSPAVSGIYGNVNALPPSLADQPPKV